MAKQLNVNLAFQADTSQALRNIQDLQKALNSLSTIKPIEGLTLTKDMQTAVNSAKELERHLGNAFNTNTGNFDLSRLNTSLKASNTDLATLTNGLLKAGIQGEQAFMKVQRALSTSAVQIKQANGALAQFWTTLKNTARWQLSSSLIHGFMGSLQQAYGYAQDLDKSLNNIRIVTGASNAEMSKFAEAANKAAKELKTTTTAYTNASLIYYQQGLSTEEVKQRTDVTVKMANAAGVSAEKVSDQLTAVWNNFAKGGENLEYYADVMTALGAATASSTDEIATGLEKFAAVAETVGLSYEYATAALATVTAETRQSADVVGTAFKTLFARLQGLQLGETLDDGTTLNKYSQALAKVGIDIMDASGEMKKMDTILDEMAEKWNTLSNAQQVALAQTVGGVRQYNQLISLMDNWDVMQTNLLTAKNSSGTLQEQADIYAESWEAANKKVKASLEGLYTDLIPTEAIVDITNGFAVVIEGVDEFIQGMGGLKSILLMISAIALNRMAPSLGAGLQTGIDKVKSLDFSLEGLKQRFQGNTGVVGELHANITKISDGSFNILNKDTQTFTESLMKGASTATKMSQSIIQQALNQGTLTDEFKVYMNDMAQVNSLQSVIERAGNRLTEAQREQLSLLQQQVIAASEKHQQEVQNLSVLEAQAAALAETPDMGVYQGDNFSYKTGLEGQTTDTLTFDSGLSSTKQMHASIEKMLTTWQSIYGVVDKTSVALENGTKHIQFAVKDEELFLELNKGSLSAYQKTVTLNERIKKIAEQTTVDASKRAEQIKKIVAESAKECNLADDVVEAYGKAADTLEQEKGMSKQLATHLQTTATHAKNFAAAAGNGTDRLKTAESLGVSIANGMAQVDTAANQTKIAINNVVEALQRGVSASLNLGTTIVKVASGLSTVAMGVNALQNMFNTLGDSGATGLEKFSAVATGSVMALQGLMVVLKGLNTLTQMHTAYQLINAAASKFSADATDEETAAILKSTIFKKVDLTQEQLVTAAKKIKAAVATGTSIPAAIAETAANYGLAASELAVLWPIGLIIAALAALALVITGVITLVDAFTVSNEEMAERTAEASKNLSESAKAAKEEAQGIKDAFTEYDEVVDALNSCTKGTDEWRKALEKVKGKVSEILDQYPDLLKYEGLLQWNEEAGAYMFNTDSSKGTTMDDVIAQANKRADTLAYASQMASGKASAAKANLSQDTYNSKTNGYAWDTDISQMTDNVERNKEIIREETRKYIKAHPESYAQDADYYLGLWEQSINSAAQAGADYATKVEEAGNVMLAASQLAASEILTNEDGTSDYDQAAANAGAAIIQSEYDRIYKDIYGTDGSDGLIGSQYSKGDNRNDVGTNGIDDVLTRYEAAIGKDVDWAANAVQGNDENRTFVYLENGDEKQLTPEQIAATIAAYESTQNRGLVEKAASAVQNIIGELAGNEDGLGAVTAISNGGEKSDMANVFANMTEGELADINKMFEDGAAQEEIAQAFGMTTDQLNTMLETFGIDFQTFADNCTAAATEVANSLTEAQQEVLTNAGVSDTSGMTMEEKIAYSNNISSAKSNLTDNELGENLINNIIGDVKNADVDPEQMSKFIGAIGALDLAAEGAAEQVSALAEEYGIEGVAIDNLITGIEGLDQVYNIATGSVIDQAASLKEVVGEGLETGDVIGAEDIKVLEDAGINVDQYFTQMADGTYTLTGKADEFNAAVNRITFEGLKRQWQDFSAAEAQVLENYTGNAYANKLRDTSSVQAGDASGNQGHTFTEYGADQLGRARLDYVNNFEAGTFDFSNEQNQLLADYTANPEMELTAEQLQMIADMIDVVNQKSAELEAQMFSTATSVAELNRIASEMGTYSLNAYGEGLISLASKYDNCTQEIEELQAAMLSGDEAMIKTKIDALELAAAIGEMSEKYGLDAEDVETHAKLLRESAAGYELTAEQAANMAVANRRMNRGVKTLNENWKDWSKILKSSNRGTIDYADTLNDAHEALADLVGAVDAAAIPLDFLDASTESGAQHLKWMEKAAQGDAEAINQLGVALSAAQVEMMEFNETAAQMAIDGGFLDSAFDLTAFNNYKAEVMEGINALQAAITNGTVATGDNIATLLDGTGKNWVESLNAMAMATGMSVDQMNALLNQLGVQAQVEVKDVPQRMKVPTYTEVSEPFPVTVYETTTLSDGSVMSTPSTRYGWRKYSIPGPSMEVDGVVQVAQISTEGNTSVGSPKITYTGTSGGSTGGGVAPSSTPNKGGGGGGGSSKPKATSDARKKRSELVDPYKEVNDQIERANHLMSKNNTLAEGMWGAARSAKMRENINLLNQEVALLEDKLAISEEQMTMSRGDLSSAAAVLGVQLNFDGNGLVSNIVDVQESIWKQREALLDSFGADIDEDEQARLDAFDEYIENFTSAYDEYESHRQTQMDTEAEQLEKQLEAQQIMFDDLNTTLEENVSLIEKDLELVEYYLSKVEDDFYGMAEAAALMVGSLSSMNPGEGGQLGAYLANLEAQSNYVDELNEKYANGEINTAQYIEGMTNAQSAIIEALTSLNELDATMKHYYGETLEAAQEELSQYTDMMEHHSEVLEHYSNLLELIGASKDWERMKTVFEAQVSVAENAAAVSKANYEMLAQEAADKKAAWEALGKGLGDELTYEESVIKQQWLDAQAAADEAQNQMLEDAAAWAESLKTLLETELAELADILNQSLSGEFGSLDNMMTAMEHANSLQEEYLTTTNQVYETNKLMHTAQQEIDKTTNSVAKRRLKQYIDETEQLQNKNKLSQFELDIQKAKYDLLVAEIALEEAQQAKSTVRLQRDSEGNFGYVYTADQNAVAAAEQELADAQNALYNIGLEGANKYAENYAQTIQEMNDAVTELTEKWQNGEIASKEEYERQMLALEEYYGEKLMQYSELHSIALTTDSRVASEAWTKDFAHMTTQTQRWMQNVDIYVQGVEASMERYKEGIDRVEQYAGLDLDSLKEKTSNIKEENKALAKSITEKDGLLDAMKAEIEEVGKLTTQYAALRTEIQGTVSDYEALLRRMGVDIDTAATSNPPFGSGSGSGGDSSTPNPGTTNPDTTNPGTTDTGTTGSDGGTKTISVGGKVNAGGAQIYDYAGDTSGESQYFHNDPVYQVLKEQGEWIQVRHHKLSSGITGWFKKSDVVAMNTGGYTGDWAGSYGKLAFLHQKELVLNAKDTENLLASMDILDKIISTIDLYSSNAQLGGMLSSPRYGGLDNEPLEQNVHIEASFPSVTDHNEIEDALNNLINRASQYAHRK